MIVHVTWVALHGGSHQSGGAVSFEAALGIIVTLLVVAGALYYAGILEPPGGSGDEESESGVGD